MAKFTQPPPGGNQDSSLLTVKNGHRSITQTPRRHNAKSNRGRKHVRKGRRK